jgi:HK97 family phage portal protein/HK97 family phage prohead protease
MMIEHRAMVEVRSLGRQLVGLAAPFDQVAFVGGFDEVIRRGAFKDSLADNHDILALLDHDMSRVLGRTKSKSLRLAETDRGLEFELDLPGTSWANDTLELVRSNNAGGMSFGFRIRPSGEQWVKSVRELRSLDLVEISVVSAFPAYDATEVAARARQFHPRLNLAARYSGNGMSIRSRIAAWLDPPEQRSITSWDLLSAGVGVWGVADASGQVITHKSAEHALATVGACVSVISGSISALPALVYVWQGDRRVEAPAHPLQRLIDRGPNQFQSWADWLEWTVASVLLRGNALSEIVLDNAGRLAGLIPIPWDKVAIVDLPNNRITYDIANDVRGGVRRLLMEQVYHLRDRSDDGRVGISRLQRAAGVLGNAQALAEFSGSLWRNSISPSGALELEGKIGPEALNQLRERWRLLHEGPRNAGRVVVLDQGAKFKSVSVSPEQAELLESRMFSVAEICRVFGVPPPLVQDYSHNTFTNSQEASRWFASNTLTPWVRKIEAEARRSLFSSTAAVNHQLVLDMSDLLRGSPLERWTANEIAVRSGILDVDEVRTQEGYPPRGTAPEAAE